MKTIENPKVLDRTRFLQSQHWKKSEEMFHAVLDSPWYRVIGAIMSDIQLSTMRFYQELGFAPVLLPITCSSISSPFGLGSDSEPVEIELFDKSIFLADSMQFHLEYLLRQGFKGVYYIMSTFRGEDPDARHLNQFFHSELEMEGTLDDVMRVVEGYVKFCTASIYRQFADQIEELGGGTKHVQEMLHNPLPFPRIRFEEALELLPSQDKLVKRVDGKIVNLTSQGEKYLMDHFQRPVWVTHFPVSAVPFYQAWTADKKSACCADLLMGIGEVVGCGQRHRTYAETLTALKHHQVAPEEYDWYLKMKKDYPAQTAGFGMGIERLILWLLNHDDIRDIPLFSRVKGFEAAP